MPDGAVPLVASLTATVAMMMDKGATYQDIEAVIGPAIQQKNYEVGDDLRSLVLNTPRCGDFVFSPWKRKIPV